MFKVLTVIGARPQIIKCAPVSRELRKVATEFLLHTGQHYDRSMSEVFFCDLSIPEPECSLSVGSGTHGYQTGEMLKGIEAVLLREHFDVVVVYGDTNSTLAGALAAAKLHVPIAHVEAGLRSFNNHLPEEINRIITDRIATYLFCPNESAVSNLSREGRTKGVFLVGDVMYDALHENVTTAESRSTILHDNGLRHKRYILLTVHRPHNTDDLNALGNIIAAVMKLTGRGETVVFPVHPRTRKQLAYFDLKNGGGLVLLEPVSYLDMLALERHARVILTDSGGVQKEAFWLGIPCVTLRNETEWTETVESGWNVLAGNDTGQIVRAVTRINGNFDGRVPPIHHDIGAAKRIVAILGDELGDHASSCNRALPVHSRVRVESANNNYE